MPGAKVHDDKLTHAIENVEREIEHVRSELQLREMVDRLAALHDKAKELLNERSQEFADTDFADAGPSYVIGRLYNESAKVCINEQGSIHLQGAAVSVCPRHKLIAKTFYVEQEFRVSNFRDPSEIKKLLSSIEKIVPSRTGGAVVFKCDPDFLSEVLLEGE